MLKSEFRVERTRAVRSELDKEIEIAPGPIEVAGVSDRRGANGDAILSIAHKGVPSLLSPRIAETQRPALVRAGRLGFTNRKLYH